MKTSDSDQPKERSNGSADKRAGREISRRSFLTTGAAAIAVPLFVPGCIRGGSGGDSEKDSGGVAAAYQAPGDKLNIAAVGLHMGNNYLVGCEQENIVALCDLDYDNRFATNTFKNWRMAEPREERLGPLFGSSQSGVQRQKRK